MSYKHGKHVASKKRVGEQRSTGTVGKEIVIPSDEYMNERRLKKMIVALGCTLAVSVVAMGSVMAFAEPTNAERIDGSSLTIIAPIENEDDCQWKLNIDQPSTSNIVSDAVNAKTVAVDKANKKIEEEKKKEAERLAAEEQAHIEAEAEAARIAAEQEAAAAAAQSYDYSESYDSSSGSYSGSIDANSFRSAGVIYDDGTRYTWYSQNVLPGGGLTDLNNNGRHVEGGYVMDGDGYIAVASSDYAQGTVLDTPFGKAKVYDSGCDSGTIDVYTDF